VVYTLRPEFRDKLKIGFSHLPIQPRVLGLGGSEGRNRFDPLCCTSG